VFSCLVDGAISNHIPADDRGLAYGDGVFETIAMRGGRMALWDGHRDRLQLGCERLGIPAPDPDLLLQELKTVAAGQPNCVVKIIVTRGSGGRGYAPPVPANPRRIVSAHPLPEGMEEDARLGVHAVTCLVRLALQPQLRGIKHLSRLEQVMAAAELAAHPGKQGVLLNTEGYVITGVQANLFAVSGSHLITPRMDRCGVHGVLRNVLLNAHGGRCERRRVTLDLLQEADEVFLCSAVRGIVPVLSLDQLNWPAGPVTREMQGWYRGLLEAR